MKYLIWLLAFALAACGEEAATVRNGMNAYQQSRVADAERMFAAVAADPAASAGDRAAANRELARIAWLIDRREGPALGFVAAAERTGEGLCHAFLLRDRILREAGKPDRMLAGLADQLERCDDAEQQAEIRLAAADAALALALDGDEAGLARASGLVKEAGDDAAGTLAGSAIRLRDRAARRGRRGRAAGLEGLFLARRAGRSPGARAWRPGGVRAVRRRAGAGSRSGRTARRRRPARPGRIRPTGRALRGPPWLG